jgi:7-carboxy-7-deazaguanine synthase
MKIKLVKNGVFPITVDKDGNKLDKLPDTDYDISGTVQGEGMLTGVPSIFIRTSGCVMRCAWEMENGEVSLCDTPYSSHNATEFDEWEVDDVVATVGKNLGKINNIVITGGEPTMQCEAVAELAEKLHKKFGVHITLETNGTKFHAKMAKWINVFSISPKLSDSIPYVEKMKKLGIDIESSWAVKQAALRKNIKVLQQYIDICDGYTHHIQLKFVVSKPENIDEINNDFIRKLANIFSNEVFLMPVGRNKEQLLASSKMVLKLAIQHGYRFCPRLHIELFGDIAGV